MYTVYGIPNCNTVKKALAWLDEHQVAYKFHNYKKEGITKAKLKAWTGQTSWEALVNKKGTTWRSLAEEEKESITTMAKAIDLMADKTSVIKRPLIELDGQVVALGFDEGEYREKLG